MDLSISTQDYHFSFDSLWMTAIDISLAHTLGVYGEPEKPVYITRKEVKKILEYLQSDISLFCNNEKSQSDLCDIIYNMWLLMRPKEKMKLRWY